MKKSLLLTAVSMLALSLHAQTPQNNTVRCGYDEAVSSAIAQHPELAAKFEEGRELQFEAAKNAIPKKSTEQVYIIPVVVHIIYNDSVSNISDAQVQNGMDVLNEDFRKMNADTVNTLSLFKDRAADIKVEFRLAHKDPNGNYTTGITRTESYMADLANDYVKDLIHWNNQKYFNIWVVKSIYLDGIEPGTTVEGYAYRPYPSQQYSLDGMVICNDQVGKIGTALATGAAYSQKGRTITHETGHYLGLLHTFQDGCDGGDGIDDTPPVAGPSYGGCSNLYVNTCHNDSVDEPDMIQNYMDYTNGNCRNLFTEGQKEVMRASFDLSSLRKILVSQANLENTGVLGVDEHKLVNNFSVYPNPATNKVSIEAGDYHLKGSQIVLNDLSGREIARWEVARNVTRYEIDIAAYDLAPGVYLLKVENKDHSISGIQKLTVR